MATTRRSFLFRSFWAGSATVAAGALEGCAQRFDPAPIADVAAPIDGKLYLEVARYPDLAKEGGALAVRIPGMATPLLLLHPSGTQYAAMAALCPHAGCPLGYSGGDVVCPCHGSRFDLAGAVLNPPAKQGPKTYSLRYEATSGDLIVDLTGGDAHFPPYQDGKVVLSLAQFPQLATAGGSVVGSPAGLGRPIVVAALEGGGYAALDATCTHLGCLVAFSARSKEVECPCHGSSFATSGAVTGGPATTPLARYAASADASAVTVIIPG